MPAAGRRYVSIFTATLRNASHILSLDRSGAIAPAFEREGSVDCFDVRDGALWFIGMQDMRLHEIYTAAAGTNAPVQRTALNADVLRDVYVAAPEKLTFRRDGLELDGWVLKPKDFDPSKRYPAILDIHGGPKTVYGEVFYHEMQLWANRGWFVFSATRAAATGAATNSPISAGNTAPATTTT